MLFEELVERYFMSFLIGMKYVYVRLIIVKVLYFLKDLVEFIKFNIIVFCYYKWYNSSF